MSRRFFHLIVTLIIGLMFVFGEAVALYAQETKSEEFTLEEITVTAEKRETNVQKTAITITAVTGSDIDAKGMTDVSKVLGEMAGVNVAGGSQGSKIFVRGIGTSVDTNQASSSVVLQQDNVYYGQSEAIANGLFDIDRVEVLYGPQGTLYGKNAAGGVVNIISNKPKDRFEANANVSIGDYNLFSWGSVVNVPLTSNFAARLAVSRQNRNGYISDGSGDLNKLLARIKLLYNPTDKISFLMTGSFSYDKSSMANSVPVAGSAGHLHFMLPPGSPDPSYPISTLLPGSSNDSTKGWVPADGWPIPFGGDAWTNDPLHPKPYNYNRYATYSLEVNWDMGWANMKLIPTLNKNLRTTVNDFINGIAMGALRGSGGFEETQYTGELDLTNGKDSPFTWTAGAYYYKSNNRQAGLINTDLMTIAENTWNGIATPGGPPGPPPTPGQVDSPQTANYRIPQDSKAYFGQITYPITDAFRLTGGFRKNIDDNNMKYRIIIYDVTQNGIYGTNPNVAGYKSDYYSLSTAVNDPTAPGGVRHVYDSGIQKFTLNSSPATYKVGLEYDLAKDNMAYAYYSTGYINGGLNIEGTVPPVGFDPEKIKAYTIGSKNRFLDNTLQLNVEAYRYDYTGYQVFVRVNFIDPLTGANNGAMRVINAKTSTVTGADINIDYLFSAEDRINISTTILKTKFGELFIPENGLAGIPGYDVTGMDLPQSPHLAVNVGYEHAFTLEDGATLTPRLETRIQSGVWTTHEVQLPGARQKGYHMSNFNLTYASANGKYNVNLWAKNLENEAVTSYVWPNYRRSILDPRTTGVTFSVKF
jgi:iron complex outermembrane recepter protein